MYSERDYDAGRKAAQRAAKRDIPLRPIKDPKRRAACEEDDCEWLKVYLGEVFKNPFTADQRTIVGEIGSALSFGVKKNFAAPRHDGKTSIARYLTLKYTLHRRPDRRPRVPLSLLINATGRKAEDSLDAIKSRLRALPGTPLWEDYPLEVDVARYVGPAPAKCNNVTVAGRLVRVEWGAGHIILPEFEDEGFWGGMLAAMGITSNDIQGFNLYDVRPTFVLLDDLDDRDSLASKDGGTIAKKIETIIDENIAGLAGPKQSLGQVMLCTIPSIHSVAFKYSDPQQKPAWSGVRLQKIKVWPKNKPLWEIYISLRQKGKQTIVEGKASDPYGREAHKFLVDNFEAMHEEAVVSNDHDFVETRLPPDDWFPEGSQTQLSTLQACYDYIADENIDSFMTEYQNDPPPEEGISRLILTAYHIQHGCLSGLDRREVPEGTVLLTVGADVKKEGLHYVVLAWDDRGAGCIVDYDFYEFLTQNRKASDCEVQILEGLHRWYEALEEFPYFEGGTAWDADLALIDTGWKDKSWASQPVHLFCHQMGFERCLPSKGDPDYRRPSDTTKKIIGDNWHVTWSGGVPIVMMNSDHWKLKVHEGLLVNRGDDGKILPGGLCLFNHPKIDGRENRNFHLSMSKHILSETYERRSRPGFAGERLGWWKTGKPNHYFDALYEAMVARSVRGINVFEPVEVVATPAPSSERPQLVTEDYQTNW